MNFAHRLALAGLKTLTRTRCRIDDAQLARVPDRGPLILVTNHINILEVPLLYTHLLPRPVTSFVAEYRWENPWLRWLLVGCEMIPLNRGQADLAAVRTALARLKRGDILAISPEGTRSEHGRMQRGRPGVVLLALRSGAPLLPLVVHGHEHFRENVRHFRRTDFHIVVGEPFTLHARREEATREVRQQIVDEVMYRLAELLPPAYRGFYADLSSATQRYLRLRPAAG